MVLINGCSYVAGFGLDNPDDSYHVAACKELGLEYQNIAIPGASNDLIRSTTISEVLANPGRYTRVHLGFTGTVRISLSTIDSNEHAHHHFLFGAIGTTTDEIQLHEIFWKKYLRVIFWVHNYAQNVYLIQEFCRNRGIACVCVNSARDVDFAFWLIMYDMVTAQADPKDILTAARRHESEFYYADELSDLYHKSGPETFFTVVKKISTMVNSIDQSKFVGLGQRHLHDCLDFWPVGNDGSHPGIEAHQHMTALVVERLKNDLHR